MKDLEPLSYYWTVDEDWDVPEPTPALYLGMLRDGKPLWSLVGLSGPLRYDPTWIGPKIEKPELKSPKS